MSQILRPKSLAIGSASFQTISPQYKQKSGFVPTLTKSMNKTLKLVYHRFIFIATGKIKNFLAHKGEYMSLKAVIGRLFL